MNFKFVMKIFLIGIITVIIISILGCERLVIEVDVPRCIKKEIRQFSQSAEGCPGAYVERLPYKDGEYIFRFVDGDCQINGSIRFLDSGCNLICSTKKIDPFFSDCVRELIPFCGMNNLVIWESD